MKHYYLFIVLVLRDLGVPIAGICLFINIILLKNLKMIMKILNKFLHY